MKSSGLYRNDPKPLGREGRREGGIHPQLSKANPDIGCSPTCRERGESLHILSETVYILKRRLPRPRPSGNRKVEETPEYPVRTGCRERKHAGSRPRGRRCYIRASRLSGQSCPRIYKGERNDTATMLIYYINASISQRERKRRGQGEPWAAKDKA